MSVLIPIGSVITLVGIILLFRCIYRVAKAKKSKLSDEELKAVLQSTVPANLGALFLSATGIITVIIGITFA